MADQPNPLRELIEAMGGADTAQVVRLVRAARAHAAAIDAAARAEQKFPLDHYSRQETMDEAQDTLIALEEAAVTAFSS